jgi:hypothetical protein
MLLKITFFALAICVAPFNALAQNLGLPLASLNYGLPARFIVVDLHVLPASTAQDITGRFAKAYWCKSKINGT